MYFIIIFFRIEGRNVFHICTKRLSEDFLGATGGFYLAVFMLKIGAILVGVIYKVRIQKTKEQTLFSIFFNNKDAKHFENQQRIL